VKLSPLIFTEVVKQLCDDGELLVERGEDGVLTEVDLIFVEL
jgi:hypothetical protein